MGRNIKILHEYNFLNPFNETDIFSLKTEKSWFFMFPGGAGRDQWHDID